MMSYQLKDEGIATVVAGLTVQIRRSRHVETAMLYEGQLSKPPDNDEDKLHLKSL